MKMGQDIGVRRDDRGGVFAGQLHTSGVEMQTDARRVDRPDQAGGSGVFGGEVTTIFCRVGFKHEMHVAGFVMRGDLREEVDRLRERQLRAESARIAVLGGAEHQAGGAQFSSQIGTPAQVERQRVALLGGAEEAQVRLLE